jgi:hypothetical protein
MAQRIVNRFVAKGKEELLLQRARAHKVYSESIHGGTLSIGDMNYPISPPSVFVFHAAPLY